MADSLTRLPHLPILSSGDALRWIRLLWLVALLALIAAFLLLPNGHKLDLLPGFALLPLVYVAGCIADRVPRCRQAGALVARTASPRRPIDYFYTTIRLLLELWLIGFFVQQRSHELFALCGLCLFLSLECYLLAVQMFRPELRERGVVLLSSVFPLGRVDAWCWGGANGDILILRASAGRHGTDVSRSLRLGFEPLQKQRVEAHLQQRLSLQTARPSRWGPLPNASTSGRRRPWLRPSIVCGLSLLVPLLLPGSLRSVLPPLPSDPPQPAKTRDGRWHQDLQYLATNLPRLHPSLFNQVSRTTFDTAVAQLDRSIPKLSDNQIVLGMARIVALAGDTHTALDLGLAEQTSRFRTYPLYLQWFGDGLYVSYTTPPYRRALGARVVQIGSLSPETANAAVSALIPHENEEEVLRWSPYYLVTPEILQALNIVPNMAQAHFVFQDAQGAQFSFDFTPVARTQPLTWLSARAENGASSPLYLAHQDQNYWYTYLSGAQTLYFQYNRSEEQPGQPFAAYVKQMLRSLADQPVNRFVLDLRNNDGGDPTVVTPLVEALKHNQTLSLPGHLYVIVGRQTLSAAIITAEQLRRQAHAIIIGGPTAGKPNFYGDIASFTLPNSGLAVEYSTQYVHEVGGDPLTLLPDVSVPVSAADYFHGRDPVLAAILGRQP